MSVTIYHNPRCSKSRETLKLLEEKGVETNVVEYLKTPPDTATLKHVLKLLGMRPRELLRTHENEYKSAGLDDQSLSDDEIIAAMVQYPKLIERPIVVNNERAIIGRPPVKALDIISG